MSLGSAINISAQSLENISAGFALISQNVANASTQGYSRELAPYVSLDAGGQGIGAKLAPSELATSAAMQTQLYGQNASASAATTTNTALAALQPVLGTVGQGNDLGSLLANLQSAFSTLLTDPASQTQQVAVVDSAQTVTQKINALSTAYGQARQSAQDALVANVATLNTALAKVGSLSSQIIVLKGQGAGTADLENQRNQALSTISGLVNAHFVEQPDGGMQVFTAGGAQLPTLGGTPLSISAATTGPTVFYPGGGLPGIMMNGADMSGSLTGGSIGANMALRDQTLPTYQGELDEFSQTLATRFSAQGLTLFSDPQGNVPAGGGVPAQSSYLGFSSLITVNPAVVASTSLVRDGTQAVAGSATGASAFTPNPDNLAGFTGMIDRVVNFSLGADVQAGVAQPAPAIAGLGPAGTLAAPFAAPATLADFATGITASQSADSATATTAAADAAGVQTSLAASLTSQTGVDVDSQLSQMVQLQNAYGANGKILSTIESMFTALLNAITP